MTHKSGLTILDVLFVIFLTLKLIGLIDWSWWCVFIPFFIQWGLNILSSYIIRKFRKKYFKY
jgi:hypothetical protein